MKQVYYKLNQENTQDFEIKETLQCLVFGSTRGENKSQIVPKTNLT